MFNLVATTLFRLAGKPCFRIYGKGRRETTWRTIEVHAVARRNRSSRWPAFLFRGTCVTWTASIIAVGWDFAEEVLREQVGEPASRNHPVEAAGGRLHDLDRRIRVGGEPWPTASEVLAHECGHTWQARRLGCLYWPMGACFTLFREGPCWFNHFENQASEQGLFGGIVRGTVDSGIWGRVVAGNSAR